MQDIDSYLQKMGVKDPALRRRLEIALPGADPAAAAGGAELGLHAVSAANAVAAAAASSGDARGAPVLLLCCDAGGSLGGLEPLVAALELPVYAVCMPEGDVAEAPADMAELASLAMKAARGVVPPGSRLLLGGEQAVLEGSGGQKVCMVSGEQPAVYAPGMKLASGTHHWCAFPHSFHTFPSVRIS